MKKLSILYVLVIFSQLSFAVCDTTSIVITATKDTICPGDTTQICAPAGYVSYNWNTGDTSTCIYTTFAGNYFLTVTDDSGCVHSSNHLQVLVYNPTPVTVAVNGDTLISYNAPEYQWLLNGIPIPGATTAQYIADIDGNYAVKITDGNGCTYSSSNVGITLSNQFSVSIGAGQAVCSGSLVTLQPAVTAGNPPYSYYWSATGNALNCNTCAIPTSTITQSSVFSVTVTDALNQSVTATVNYSVSGSGNLPQLSLNNTNISCVQPVDTTTAVITGGTAPFTISWGDGVIAPSNYSPAIHNYGQPGVYVISLTDTLGCATSAFDTVQNNGISLTVAQEIYPTCATSATGKIKIAASGGTPPYIYLWNTGASTDSIINVPSQYYSLTVTDSTGCSFTQTLLLAALDGGLYIYLNTSNANCANNGSASLTVYNGIPPYSYSWSNSATTQTITNLSSGTYSVTITDSLGCTTAGGTYINSNCYSYITGVVFIDSNNNCVFDSSEQPANSVIISATGPTGQVFYSCTDINGNYSVGVNATGAYSMVANNISNGLTCGNITLCGNANQIISVATLGDTVANNNFAFTGSAGFDLTMHPGWTSANPGFQKEYWVMPFNQAYAPFNGPATVVFTYDSNLIYQYSLAPQPAVDLTAHTLTWVIDSVPYPTYDWNNVRFQNFFLVPSNLSLSYLLQSDFYITPTTGDCDTANNNLYFSEVVTGSHDPNEKTVEPSGQITENDSVLIYTIHFQNTGTDSTHFVVVVDTLSSNLNAATVQNLASSNKYSGFSISGKGILTWIFNPLRLPDSTASVAGSKGFITFSVKKAANLPVGTSISNTASVYFDYNQPVRTNAATDTIAIPSAVTDIRNEGISVTAFPNPFADYTNIVVKGINEKYGFELFDVTGQMLKEIANIQQNQFKLNRDELPSGLYFYRLNIGSQQIAYGKLVVQ